MSPTCYRYVLSVYLPIYPAQISDLRAGIQEEPQQEPCSSAWPTYRGSVSRQASSAWQLAVPPCRAVRRKTQNSASRQSPQPCWAGACAGSLWHGTQQGKRPVHCETYYSLSYSASAPLPAAQSLPRSGWKGCGHHRCTLHSQEPSSKGRAEA